MLHFFNFVIQFEAHAGEAGGGYADAQAVAIEDLLSEFDGGIGHDHAHATEIDFGIAERLQVLHPCLMHEGEYAVVAQVPAVVQVGNANGDDGGETEMVGQLNFDAGHGDVLPKLVDLFHPAFRVFSPAPQLYNMDRLQAVSDTVISGMNTIDEIWQLAWQRLNEASILSTSKMYDGAFYLAGYSVELALKARIVQRMGIPNLFADMSHEQNIEGINEIRRAVKTHNLFTLLILGGLKEEFDREKARNTTVTQTISLLFGAWSESARYKPCGFFSETDVTRLVSLLKDETGLLIWIGKS